MITRKEVMIKIMILIMMMITIIMVIIIIIITIVSGIIMIVKIIRSIMIRRIHIPLSFLTPISLSRSAHRYLRCHNRWWLFSHNLSFFFTLSHTHSLSLPLSPSLSPSLPHSHRYLRWHNRCRWSKSTWCKKRHEKNRVWKCL